MKRMKLFLSLLLCTAILLVGCGSWSRLKEDKIIRENIKDLFTALDAKDVDAFKALFSQEAIDSDKELDEKIERLFALYPTGKTTYYYDGLNSGSYEDEGEKHKSAICANIPAQCDGEWFFVVIELIYEDDFDAATVGVRQVFVHTADEEYLRLQEKTTEWCEEAGLFLFADRTVEGVFTCIWGSPARLTSFEGKIDLDKAKALLERESDWSSFKEQMGEPYAVTEWEIDDFVYYDIGNGEYLQLCVEDGVIDYASIVDRLYHLETVTD